MKVRKREKQESGGKEANSTWRENKISDEKGRRREGSRREAEKDTEKKKMSKIVREVNRERDVRKAWMITGRRRKR